FGAPIDAVTLFTYPTLRSLGGFLADQGLGAERLAPIVQRAAGPAGEEGDRSRDVAIVGLACRLPGAASKEEFWANQAAGRNCIREVPKDRWDCDALLGDPHRDDGRTDVKWGGFIAGEDLFSPEFFGISTYEAELMDPQHRLFLKAAWEAIWDAGYDPKGFGGRAIGVFAGVQFQDYQKLLNDRKRLSAQVCTGNAHAMLANRVSFLLDIHGPSEAVDTACSSSLVAVHRAVRAIREGECELAIAGGVNLLLTPDLFIMGRQLGVLSPTGQCRTFDAGADGYVRAEGVGALLLKPFADAQKDRDHIYAVIKGTAVNHGGKAASLTAPNSRAQSDLVVRALRDARLTPNDIAYVEMHGTGTELGDPIEVEGVKSAFRRLRSETGLTPSPCAIGSVKTNIGHLEPAAGVAGVANVLMAMQHGRLPGLSNFRRLNPQIVLEDGLFVQAESGAWPVGTANAPLAAVVNSFGFGGANASIVLQQEREAPRRESRAGEIFVPISGSSAELIKLHAGALARAIEAAESRDDPAQVLRDVAFTLQSRNENRPVRAVIRASAVSELKNALAAMAAGSPLPEDTAIFGPAPSPRADWPDHVWLWLENGNAAWPDLPDAKRLPLPISPWPDKRCWFEEREIAGPQATGSAMAELAYLRPVWRQKAAVPGRRLDHQCIWLIGRDDEHVEAFRAELHEHLPAKATLLTSVVKDAATGPEPSLEVWNLAGDEPDIIVLLPERQPTLDPAAQAETKILFGLAKELMERSFDRNVDVFHVAAQEFGAASAIDALAALAKSAFLENERLRILTLYLGDKSRADWPSLLAAELASEPAETPLTIRYAASRALRELEAAQLGERQAPSTSWFRDGGVYLVPGGAGELGYRLLEKLLEEIDATFILSGRSPCDGAVKQRVDALAAKARRPDRVGYIQCDIADLDQTRAMVRAVAERHGRVNGILNLVTAHNDAYLFN
ncbi:MAG: KR domain-containing protein, partial [Hyphomicrobiales bacterium]|nr:KR domain-containing protein [Hyphomicrobiales bacterium]